MDGGRFSAALEKSMSQTSANSARNRSVLIITVLALGLYLLVRVLPTGTNLNHMDFRTEGKGALEFCDANNPQFIPVVQVRSPVVLGLKAATAVAPDQPVVMTLTLQTASGKPIAPEDLVLAHTRKLHLLIVDPTLEDYQHLHPEPGKRPGEWVFTFTPQRAGIYRIFADFTPVATVRGLYGVVELTVPGSVARLARSPNLTYTVGEFEFSLAAAQNFRARQPIDLRFRVNRRGGGSMQLQPVMGAFAHLVAFDEGRSGFAHLHPAQADLKQALDSVTPELTFKLTIPQPGRYVIWSQVMIAGREIFAPFWIDVLP